MLLEFRVSNYRSILGEQVLNLVATKDKVNLLENCAPTGLRGLPHVVRSAAIYGANASGKSNLVHALGFFQSVVKRSAQSMTEGDAFDFEPFRFVRDPNEVPTEMEVTFVEAGVRYQYGFCLDRQRVCEEWLLVYKSRKPQEWFQRQFDETTRKEEYSFGSYLTGERKLWQRSTRANALFLSTAVHLNSDQLRPIFRWITERLTTLSRITPASTINMMESPSGKSAVMELLGSADLGIKDAVIKQRPFQESWPQVELEHEAVLDSGERLSAFLPLEEESLGTLRMFSLAAPILDALGKGHVLVIDELERSLHPNLTRFVVSLFHQARYRESGAQLVFTTHSTSLLDHRLLRRDQVLLVQKGRNLATVVYPLTDFHARKDAPLEKSYLQGRLGAVPFIDF